MTTPIRWPAEAVWEAVAPLLPGFTVEVLPSIDSTNTELMRRARAGRLEPVLLVAEAQTLQAVTLAHGVHLQLQGFAPPKQDQAALFLIERQQAFVAAALSGPAILPAEPPSRFTVWISRFSPPSSSF